MAMERSPRANWASLFEGIFFLTSYFSLGQNPTGVSLFFSKFEEAQLEELKKQVKGDTIDFDQFCSLLQKQMKAPTVPEEDIIAAFKVFDREGNGLISAAEMRHVMTNIGIFV